MEKFIYLFLPMSLLLVLFIKKDERIISIIRKYFSLCFVNNIICLIIITIYDNKMIELNSKINFVLKYSLLSILVGLVMAIIYNIFSSLFRVKFEVQNEEVRYTKKKKKNK